MSTKQIFFILFIQKFQENSKKQMQINSLTGQKHHIKKVLYSERDNLQLKK